MGMGSVYLPGLPACFASKGEEATENGSKTDNQAVVRKAETKKKIATIWNAESTGVPFGPKFQGASTESLTRHTFFRGAGEAG